MWLSFEASKKDPVGVPKLAEPEQISTIAGSLASIESLSQVCVLFYMWMQEN